MSDPGTDTETDMDMDLSEPVSPSTSSAEVRETSRHREDSHDRDERISTTPAQAGLTEHNGRIYTAEEIDAAHALLDLSREAREFNRGSDTESAAGEGHEHGYPPAPDSQRALPAPAPAPVSLQRSPLRRPVQLNHLGRPVIRHHWRRGALRRPAPAPAPTPAEALAEPAAGPAQEQTPVQGQGQDQAPGQSPAEMALGMRREPMTAEQALQAYLLRQQFIAGIPFERMTPMNRRRLQGGGAGGGPPAPALIRFTNNGVSVPDIPPARFDVNGVFYPLPTLPPGFGHDGHRDVDQTPDVQAYYPMSDCFRQNVGVGNEGRGRAVRQDSLHCAPDVRGERGKRGRQPSEDRSQKRRRIERSPTSSVETKTEFKLLEELVKYPNLCFKVLRYLDASGFGILYEVSEDIEGFVNRNYLKTFDLMASRVAPESANIFPARCYPRVCVDHPPVRRRLQLCPLPPLPAKVPSAKWLQMIQYREEIVHDILTEMENAGVDLPERCSVVVKKLWFLMDVPDNRRRVWTIQNKSIWPDADIFLGVLFLVKLESVLHESFGLKSNRVRRLLVAQPGLRMMHGVLCKRDALQTPFLLYQAYVRWKYTPFPHEIGREVFGVPVNHVGRLQYEGYGHRHCRDLFLAPDELILRECQERELDLGELHVDFFWYDRMPAEGIKKYPDGREGNWEEEVETSEQWWDSDGDYSPLQVAISE